MTRHAPVYGCVSDRESEIFLFYFLYDWEDEDAWMVRWRPVCIHEILTGGSHSFLYIMPKNPTRRHLAG